METKACYSCKTIKSVLEFHKDKDSKTGYSSKCKECKKLYYQINKDKINKTNERYRIKNRKQINERKKKNRNDNKDELNRLNREWYQQNKQKQCEKVKERMRKIRLEVLIHYSENPPKCKCCGETYLEFLTIDHINGNGSEHRRNMKNSNIYVELRSKKFPEGFRVLCWNCNSSRGCYGYCPHEKETI